jgi:guanylate kinase
MYSQDTVTVFVLPPSLDVLKNRIQNRCSKTNKKEVTQRIDLARKELLAATSFDYCIMNQNLKIALSELKEIFLKAIKV